MDTLPIAIFVQTFFLVELVGFVTMFTIFYLLLGWLNREWNVDFEEGDFGIVIGLSLVWPLGLLILSYFVFNALYNTWRYQRG